MSVTQLSTIALAIIASLFGSALAQSQPLGKPTLEASLMPHSMSLNYRNWIRHPVVLPDVVPHAWARNGEIVFFGSTYMPNTWVHVSSHVLDQYAIPVNNIRYSVSQKWLNTIAQDPDVPDAYANSNSVEDFAQVANITMFDKTVPGGFGSVKPTGVKYSISILLHSPYYETCFSRRVLALADGPIAPEIFQKEIERRTADSDQNDETRESFRLAQNLAERGSRIRQDEPR
ncbi:hypothetical protein C8J56DRAFT_1108906 [Mycena floridula]|nr:hypothetical protein C8J56DRAFT_1108906 [Mycena floridula]